MHNKEASKNKDERRMSSLDNIIYGHTSCHGHGHRGWSLIPNPNPNPRPSILISGRFIAISQKKKLNWVDKSTTVKALPSRTAWKPLFLQGFFNWLSLRFFSRNSLLCYLLLCRKLDERVLSSEVVHAWNYSKKSKIWGIDIHVTSGNPVQEKREQEIRVSHGLCSESGHRGHPCLAHPCCPVPLRGCIPGTFFVWFLLSVNLSEFAYFRHGGWSSSHVVGNVLGRFCNLPDNLEFACFSFANVVCGWCWNSICQGDSMCKKNLWKFIWFPDSSPGQSWVVEDRIKFVQKTLVWYSSCHHW